MKKNVVISSLLFLVVVIFSLVVLAREVHTDNLENNDIKDSASGIILFYGDGCPHCKIVEEYLDSNNVSEKIEFKRKEVYHNKQNSLELAEKAKVCGISTNSIGVPFLWDGEKCLIGDKDIVDFFKQKINK